MKTTLKQRNTIMKRNIRTSRFLWKATTFALLILSTGVMLGQDMVNTGTFTNGSGGTVKVKGTFTPGHTSYDGTVEFYGAAQSVPAITYKNLKATGSSGNKTFAGNTTVTGDITVNQTSNGFVLASTDTLDLQKPTTVPITLTSGTFDVSAGTTKYATGTQVVFGTTYKNLITSGGDKTASGSVTVSSGGTFTNSVITNFGSNAFTGTGATFANTGTLQSAGTVTLSSATSVNGTFTYNSGVTAQTIADATYTGTLDISGAADKTIRNVNVSGSYTVAGGTRTYDGTFTYNGSGAQTIAGDTYDSLALSGSGTKTFASAATINTFLTSSVPVQVDNSVTVTLADNATANLSDNLTVNGTFDADATGATTNFNGGAQTISGAAATISFNNLTLSGTDAKTSSVGLNVAGTFTPTYGIDMGASAVLSITNSAAAAVGSYGTLQQVKGSMKRAIAANGSFYRFNDSATGLTFTGATITDFTLKVEPSTNPTGYAATTHVNRKVTASYTGWSAGTAAMTLGYLNGEKPSQDENKLRFFKAAGVKLATGSASTRTPSSSSSWGAIALSNITFGSSTSANAELPTNTQIIMSNSGAALISIAAADWNTGSTWDEGYVPTLSDDVEINTAVSVNANASAASLVVNATKSLTISTAATTVTVNGAATNNGTITVDANTTLNVAKSGTGTFNNAGTVTNNGTVIIGD